MEAKNYFRFDNAEGNAQECKKAIRQYKDYLQVLSLIKNELAKFDEKPLTKRFINTLNKKLEAQGSIFHAYFKSLPYLWKEIDFYTKGENESAFLYIRYVAAHFLSNTKNTDLKATYQDINRTINAVKEDIENLVKAQKDYNKEVTKFQKVMQAIKEYNETRNGSISPYIFPQISKK